MGNMLTSLLVALGDPLAERGNMGVKYHRLERFLVDCGVRMLMWMKPTISSTATATRAARCEQHAEKSRQDE